MPKPRHQAHVPMHLANSGSAKLHLLPCTSKIARVLARNIYISYRSKTPVIANTSFKQFQLLAYHLKE